MKLNREGLKDKEFWQEKAIKAPTYDIEKIIKNTKDTPRWIHFGGGNIFRGFIARLQDELLEKGLDDIGIIAAETFDFEIIDKIYKPYDNLVLSVGLRANGETKKQVLASISDSVKASISEECDFERLKKAFRAPSLQMASFTIGLTSPPVGPVLNVACATGKIRMEEIIKPVIPYYIFQMALVYLFILFPGLITVPLGWLGG